MKTREEFHQEQMKDWKYRFWWYLYCPYYKVALPLWIKLKQTLRTKEHLDD